MSLLSGFVQTVHDVRRGLFLEDSDALSEEDELEQIMQQLSRLDGLENCNELEVVRRLKRELLLHIPAPQQGDADEMTVQGLSSGGSGLEAVRRQLLQEVSISATELLESEETQWLEFINSEEKGSKKKKSSGYFSFNFDDIPLFEPLEHTLSILRMPFPESAAAIPKLMELDMSELLEHPQWRELVDLLFTTFEAAKSKCRAQILHLHVRFMHGMQGQQAADISNNLVKIFRKRWLLREADDDVAISSNQQSTGDEDEDEQVAVFLEMLVHVLPQMQYCESRTADHFVATLFLLLARGLAFRGTVPVLDLLTGETSFGLLGLVRARPISVALHAIGSSLFSVLSIRLQASAGSSTLSDSILFFGLLRPLFKFPRLVELISSNQVDQRFMWDGRMTQSGDEVLLVVMPNTNRAFYQLSSASSPFELLLMQQDTENADDGSFYQLVSACCSLMSATLKSDVVVSMSEEAGVKRLVLLLLELVADGPGDVQEPTLQSLLQILQGSPSMAVSSLLPTFVGGLRRVTVTSVETVLIEVWIQVTEMAFAVLQSRNDLSSSLSSLFVNGILPTWTNQCLLSACACRPCAPNSRLSVTLLQLCNFCVEQANPGDTQSFNVLVVYLAAMLLGNSQLLINHNNGLFSRAIDVVLIALSASHVVEQSLLVSSLLAVAKLCGPKVLTMAPALHSVALETLDKFLTSPDVWDHAHAPLNYTIPLFQLLVHLARDGHIDTAFEVLTLASPALQSHCHERKIGSAKAFLLAGNPDDDETSLTSQGMYPLLLRMLNAGLSGKYECIETFSL
jgi:hypothetical protein